MLDSNGAKKDLKCYRELLGGNSFGISKGVAVLNK